MNFLKKRPILSSTYLIPVGLMGLSGFLNLYRLDQEGFGNTYYAAGVKSMLMSWHNFFFVSFDPAGFVSIDKPPLGLWIQSLSAFVFGFSGWALILPQAVAGILSTLLIYFMVRKYSGQTAAVLSALFFCITPISVATDRNNTMDGIVVLISLLASLALIKALNTGKSGWLFLCMVCIGLGFNTKMSQAYLILPACWVTYLLIARPLKEKIKSLLLSGIVLFLISFMWMAIVDLTPPGERPYVGGSQTNSTFELAVNYNGIARWIGLPILEASTANLASDQPVDGILPDETGFPGVFRLFNRQLAGQISWLLPVACLSLIFLLLPPLRGIISIPEKQMLIFWGIWLVTGIVFFSVAVFFHRHYLVMMAPPIAVLAGIGLAKCLSLSERKDWRSWLFPVFMIIGTVTLILIVRPFATWNKWLLPAILAPSLVTILALIVRQVNAMNKSAFFALLNRASSGISIVCLVIPQMIWAGIPVFMGGNGGLPLAGPDVLTWNRQPIDVDIGDLINTIIQAYRGEKYYLGTLDYDPAEWIILKTGKPVLTIGGFYGTDPILSSDGLAKMVEAGRVRLFFVYEKTVHELRPDLFDWFHKNCTPQYLVPSDREDYFQLYDCR